MVWYYVKDGARQGPVEEDEINRLVAQSVVTPTTLVWHEGMAEWKPYSELAPVTPPPVPAPEPVKEPEPEPVVEAAPVTAAAPIQYCSQCGKPFPEDQMVRVGSAAVCADCKTIYQQKLQEAVQVAGPRVYAGFWIRFLAVLIDGLVLSIVDSAIGAVTGPRVFDRLDFAFIITSLSTAFTVSTAVNLLYEAFFLVQFGATPGKMVLKLKVITPDGGGISWGRAIGRHCGKWLSAFLLMIGFIMAGFDPEKRALHDYLAGTRVIKTAP
jgi:uncharacterized RDD family membrane protein YckC